MDWLTEKVHVRKQSNQPDFDALETPSFRILGACRQEHIVRTAARPLRILHLRQVGQAGGIPLQANRSSMKPSFLAGF